MGATEEQMHHLSDANVTHVSYILILYSVSFLLYLFVNILLHLYATHAWPDDESNGTNLRRSSSNHHERKISTYNGSTLGLDMNGGARAPAEANGSARLPAKNKNPRPLGADTQHVRDAEEFELEGLISEGEAEDDESGSSSSIGRKDGPPTSKEPDGRITLGV